MRRAILASFALMAAACATSPEIDDSVVPTGEIYDFNNSAILSNPDKILAFVGRKIQVVEFDREEDRPPPDPDLKEDEERVLIFMDSGFKARYKVLELVHGDYSAETVDFKVYDHYGFPSFAKMDIALLYLFEADGKLVHWKYTYNEVHPTADGRYAGCGDPYFFLDETDDEDRIDRRPLQSINFNPPVVFNLAELRGTSEERKDFSAEELTKFDAELDAYFVPPIFEINGDIATCKMGAYPDELFRIMIETRFLPVRREKICREKFGYTQRLPSSADELSKRNAEIRACAAEMKERGEP